MKKIALLSGFCAVAAGAFAQNSSVVTIPAFQNRFGTIHQPVVAVHTVNRSAFETRSFGGSTYTSDPAARGVVTSPTATARGALDAGRELGQPLVDVKVSETDRLRIWRVGEPRGPTAR